MELKISQSSSNHEANEVIDLFQKTFTQGSQSTGSPYLHFMDACTQALAAQDSARRVTQFVFRQFISEINKNGGSSGRLKQSFDRLQNEYAQLQKSAETERHKAQQAVNSATNQVTTLQQQLCDAQERNTDLLKQVNIFRQQLHHKDGMAQFPPSSPGSLGRGGSITSRSQGSGGGFRQPHPSQVPTHQQYQQPRHPFSTTNRGSGPPPQEIHANRPQMRGMAPHTMATSGRIDPTPIRVAPSFEQTRNNSISSGAPPVRNVRPGYTFTSNRNSGSMGSGNNNRNSSSSNNNNNNNNNGPVRRMQQSYSSRPSSFGRPSTMGFIGGSRRR